MGKLIHLNNLTRIDLPANRVLEGAIDKLDGVVIAGYTKDGEHWFASSYADGGTALWLIEKLKQKLMEYNHGEA